MKKMTFSLPLAIFLALNAIFTISCEKENLHIDSPNSTSTIEENDPSTVEGDHEAHIKIVRTDDVIREEYQYDDQKRVVRKITFNEDGVMSKFENWNYQGNGENVNSIESKHYWDLMLEPFEGNYLGFDKYNDIDFEYNNQSQLERKTTTNPSGSRVVREYEYTESKCALSKITSFQENHTNSIESLNFEWDFTYQDENCSYIAQDLDTGKKLIIEHDAHNSAFKHTNLLDYGLPSFAHNIVFYKNEKTGSQNSYTYEYDEYNYPVYRVSEDNVKTTYHYLGSNPNKYIHFVESATVAKLVAGKIAASLSHIANDLEKNQEYNDEHLYSSNTVLVNGFTEYVNESNTTSSQHFTTEKDEIDVELRFNDYVTEDEDLRIYRGKIDYYERDYEHSVTYLSTGQSTFTKSHLWVYEASVQIVYKSPTGKTYQDFLTIKFSRNEDDFFNPEIEVYSTASNQWFEI